MRMFLQQAAQVQGFKQVPGRKYFPIKKTERDRHFKRKGRGYVGLTGSKVLGDTSFIPLKSKKDRYVSRNNRKMSDGL